MNWKNKNMDVVLKNSNLYIEKEENSLELNLEEIIGLYIILREVMSMLSKVEGKENE